MVRGMWLTVRLTLMLTAVAWLTTTAVARAAPTSSSLENANASEDETTTTMALNEESTDDTTNNNTNNNNQQMEDGWAAAAACEGAVAVRRGEWGARVPVLRERQPAPSAFAVVHHTFVPGACATRAACAAAMRSMQRVHQDERRFNDVGYSFAVGGDGRVYEGRGWGVVGAHSPKYNDNGVGVAFIGDYRTEAPPEHMVSAVRALLACGVRLGHLREDYGLLGHRQVRDTECPGDALFTLVRSWPHWQEHPPVTAFRNGSTTTITTSTTPITTTTSPEQQ